MIIKFRAIITTKMAIPVTTMENNDSIKCHKGESFSLAENGCFTVMPFLELMRCKSLVSAKMLFSSCVNKSVALNGLKWMSIGSTTSS